MSARIRMPNSGPQEFRVKWHAPRTLKFCYTCKRARRLTGCRREDVTVTYGVGGKREDVYTLCARPGQVEAARDRVLKQLTRDGFKLTGQDSDWQVWTHA